eukprot:scaffold50955_cov19-Tisochrysis_lutea.AAC.1
MDSVLHTSASQPSHWAILCTLAAPPLFPVINLVLCTSAPNPWSCAHLLPPSPVLVPSHGPVALLWAVPGRLAVQPAALGAGGAQGARDQPG